MGLRPPLVDLPMIITRGALPPEDPPLWASGPHWLISPQITWVNPANGGRKPVVGGSKGPGPPLVMIWVKPTNGVQRPILWMDEILPVDS